MSMRDPFSHSTPYAKELSEQKKDWQPCAACHDAPPDLFFFDNEESNTIAKKICSTCPVRKQCLEYALAIRPSDGVWGGLTADERHKVQKRLRGGSKEPRTVQETVKEILRHNTA